MWGLLTAFLGVKQFHLFTFMSEVDTESQSHKKLQMSLSRPAQIIWDHLRTTVWEVPAQKLQVVADTLKGTCPWECSTGGFMEKVLGCAPYV